MTVEAFKNSALHDATPPASLTEEALALWHAKKGNWDQAHNIAQEIHTPLGSWIHALLHMIEGDMGNAQYWFHRAGKPSRSRGEIEALWNEIAAVCLA